MTQLETLDRCDLCQNKQLVTLDPENYISQCRRCGYIFDNPRPTKKSIKNYYSTSANFDYWTNLELARAALWQRRVNLVKKYRSPGNLLDIGAGIGEFLNAARHDFQISGTEVSAKAIQIAKSKYHLNLLAGEVEDMDIKDNQFDIITLFHVLEHVSSPARLIDKCQQLLNKDGLIIIAVPNDINAFLKLPLKRLFRRLKVGHFKAYGKFGIPRIRMDSSFGEIHLSHFTPNVLVKTLEARGFRIIDNTLDPYFGGNSLKEKIKFNIFFIINRLLQKNYYETILVVAQKK